MGGTHKHRRNALWPGGLGIVTLATAALWGTQAPAEFFFGYLSAFVLACSLPLGSAALLMLFHLTGGRWGKGIRPELESATLSAVILLVLVIPVLLGIPYVYVWADPAFLQQHPAAQLKTPYLNTTFFTIRALAFTLAWAAGGAWLASKSRLSTRTSPDSPAAAKVRRFCAGGLVAYGLTTSLAGIDWIASLEPTWYSSIFGLYVIAGQAVAALCISVLLVAGRRPDSVASARTHANLLHDLGNLLLAFVTVHAYLGFSQFFLIWIADLPEETVWFRPRMEHGWEWVAVALVALHFAIPFGLLLFRGAKRRAATLMLASLLVLSGHVLETLWMVLPSFGPPSWSIVGVAALSAASLGALWFGAYRTSTFRLQERMSGSAKRA